MGEENGTSPFFGNVTWVEIFGDVTSVVFGNVTSMAKTDFFGDVTANRSCVRQTDFFFIHSCDDKGLHSFLAVLKNPFASVCSCIGEKEEKGGESVIGLNFFSPHSLSPSSAV